MFARPTLTQLRDQAINDVLIGTGFPTLLRRSPLRALAYGQAGLTNGQYGYLDWIARQSAPFTAQGVYLEGWGALVGINRLAATAATGTASGLGTGTVPAGTVLRRSDAQEYTTQADLILASSGSTNIIASSAGAQTTLDNGSTLTLVSPILGVQSTFIATNDNPGSDQETDQALRTRILKRYAEPPQGGSEADYIEWALAVPGVTRAWVNPLGAGAGSVVVYTMFDVSEAAHAGFPQGANGVATLEKRDTLATGDQLAVANAIYPLRPATALVYSVSPIAYPVNFTIHLSAAISSDTQAAVLTAIDFVCLAYSTPLDAELDLSLFEAAISSVPGMPPFTLTSPFAAITAPLGHLPVRGAVTYA